VAKYEFKIELPIYLPQAAIEELKMRLKDRMRELVAKCGEYQVDLEVRMKVAAEAEKEEEEEEA
jgi:hypothetical protein